MTGEAYTPAAAAELGGPPCALFELPAGAAGCDLTATGVPDLTMPDRIVLSTSGGADSQLTTKRVTGLARAAGVLDRVVAVHAYLPEDHPDAEDYARMHAEAYGVPRFVTVRRDGGILEHAAERGAFPSSKVRWCTSRFKREPITALLTLLTDELDPVRLGRRVRILNVMGMRAQESTARERRAPFRHNERASNLTRRHVDDWLPIHHVLKHELRAELDADDVPHHPSYDGDDGEPWAGTERFSCVLCVMASRHDLVLNAARFPRVAAQYLQVELETGFDFRQDLPMRDIVAQAARQVTKRR